MLLVFIRNRFNRCIGAELLYYASVLFIFLSFYSRPCTHIRPIAIVLVTVTVTYKQPLLRPAEIRYLFFCIPLQIHRTYNTHMCTCGCVAYISQQGWLSIIRAWLIDLCDA